MIEYTVSVYSNKTEWRLNGKFHREDGPARVWVNGTKEWILNGKRHREGGPAMEWFDGNKSWWLNGKRHREDGPAVEHVDGYKEWWLKGKSYTEEEFNAKMNPVRELSVAEISKLLGYEVKVVK